MPRFPPPGGAVTLVSEGGHIDINSGGTVNSGGGAVTILGDTTVDIDASVSSSGGDVTVVTEGRIDVDASVNSGNGNVVIASGSNTVDIAASVTSSGYATFLAGNDVFVGGTVSGADSVFMSASDLIQLSSAVSSSGGGVTLNGGRVIQNSGGDISAARDVGVITSSGSINMNDGATTTSGNARPIVYISATTADITGLNADNGAGAVTVVADGSITDAGDSAVDIRASDVFLVSTNGGIGTSGNALEIRSREVAGFAGAGGINLREVAAGGDVKVGETGPTSISLAGPTGTPFVVSVPAVEGLFTTGNGDIALTAEAGKITVGSAIAALGSGDILLDARGSGSDLEIDNTVLAADGSISLLAARSVLQNSNVLSTAGGTIDVRATDGGIHMADGVVTLSGGGNIRYQARQDIRLSGLVATQAYVAVDTTLGSINDGGDLLPDVIALGAQFRAPNGRIGYLGAITNPLETVLGQLAAEAGSGGVNIFNIGDLTVDTVPQVAVKRVAWNGIDGTVSSAALSGITTDPDGHVILVNAGELTVAQPVAAGGAGNVLLIGGTSSVSTVTLDAGVSSGSGALTIISAGSIDQTAGGDITTGGGDITAMAAGGAITMADGAESLSTGGDILYLATSDIEIGSLNAATGDVSILALSGSIVDGGDTHRDVIARDVQFFAAAGGIGNPGDGLETTVETMAAFAGDGSVKVTESDDLVIGTVGPIAITQVNADGSLSVTNSPTLSGITVTNGAILVDTEAGSIHVINPVLNLGPGDVLLEANGPASDIVVSNIVLAQNGNMSVLAEGSLWQYANLLGLGTGSIDVRAETGSIVMSNGTFTLASAGNIRYHADKNVVLSSLISPSSNVSVRADLGSILDGGDAQEDVIAPGVRLVAGHGVGTHRDPLETLVAVTTARAKAGGIHLVNHGPVIVDSVPDVTVQRVQPNGMLTQVTDAQMSDLATTAGGGDIELATRYGTILVNDGNAPQDGYGVRADAGGNIKLDANGGGSHVILNTGVLSGWGNICLLADDSVLVNTAATQIRTGGNGSIVIWADMNQDQVGDVLQLGGDIHTANGNITMFGQNVFQLDNGVITSDGGSVSIQAPKTILLAGGGVKTGSGSMAMSAGNITLNTALSSGGTLALAATRGSIGGAGSVSGGEVSLSALFNIGSAFNPLDVRAGTLATRSILGNTYMDVAGSTEAGRVAGPVLAGGVPPCGAGIPVTQVSTLDGIHSAGYLYLSVLGDLTGNTVSAGGDADVDVGGSVDIGLLSAGGRLDADVGDRLTFGRIRAGEADVNADEIRMATVEVGGKARFRARGSIVDNGSNLRAGDVVLSAGGNIGSGAPIRMNVGAIDTIRAGGDVNIVQNRGGDTPLGLISAGGQLTARVPSGGLIDRNGDTLNLQARAATIYARRLGTLQDALEVDIGPGNMKVNGSGLSGDETGDDYIFVNLAGNIELVNGHAVDYFGDEPIPGFVILNGQVIGGKESLLQRVFRSEAFLSETLSRILPNKDPQERYFLEPETPPREDWETIEYIPQQRTAPNIVNEPADS